MPPPATRVAELARQRDRHAQKRRSISIPVSTDDGHAPAVMTLASIFASFSPFRHRSFLLPAVASRLMGISWAAALIFIATDADGAQLVAGPRSMTPTRKHQAGFGHGPGALKNRRRARRLAARRNGLIHYSQGFLLTRADSRPLMAAIASGDCSLTLLRHRAAARFLIFARRRLRR